MKKFIFLTMFLLLMMSSICFAANPEEIIFCETFNDQWAPIKKSNEFNTLTISLIAKSKKSYGIHKVALTIYKIEGARETLVDRRYIEVNPEWDTTGVRYLQLPSVGEYTIALTTPQGETLNKGKIKILKGDTSNNQPKEETLGARLEALFKKYSPK